MNSVTRCITLLGAVASFAAARAVTVEVNATGFNKAIPYNCTKESCPFSYTPPSGFKPQSCGEVDAASRMPDSIWDDANAVQEYVAAIIKWYTIQLPEGGEVKLVNSLCDHAGGRARINKTQSAPWTSSDLMKDTCGALCGCTYPACPDVPNDPTNHTYCSLCGPKFNQPINVTLWAVDGRTQQWSFTTPKKWSIDASPALSTDGRTMFVSDYDTSLYAVATAESNRPAGVAYWKFTTGDTPYGNGAGNSPTVSPDGKTVYVGALDGYLYAVATADGTQRWRFATNDGPANINTTPIVSADSKTVYVSRLTIGFIAINAATGVPRWELPISIGFECGAVLSPDDGTVYVSKSDEAAHNGNFYAINTANGKKRWTADTTGYYYYSPAVSPDGNTVYVGSSHISTNTGSFYALNAADGTPRWSYTAGGTAWSQPVVSPNSDTVYVGHDGDSFHAINAADGTLRWEIPELITDFSIPVLSHDGSTVYVLLNERLCAVDTTYGTLQWEFVEQGGDYVYVDSSVALGPDGRTVYVGAKSTNEYKAVVYAMLTAPPPPPPPPPMPAN